LLQIKIIDENYMAPSHGSANQGLLLQIL